MSHHTCACTSNYTLCAYKAYMQWYLLHIEQLYTVSLCGSVVLAMLFILQMILVVYHIVHHNAEPNKVKERPHASVLDVDILCLVSVEALDDILRNGAKFEVLYDVFSHVPQLDLAKVVRHIGYHLLTVEK